MATAILSEQKVTNLKNFDLYLREHDFERIHPYFIEAEMAEGQKVEGSFFSFDKSNASNKVFGTLKAVYQKENDVVINIDSDLVDSGKSEFLLNKDGTFSLYNPDFEKLPFGKTVNVSVAAIITEGKSRATVNEINLEITGTNEAPTVAYPLYSSASENDPIYPIDLLEGAKDVDEGDVLSVKNVTEETGQGGWVVNGSKIEIDPDYFDDLNDGETGTLNFNYLVTDEYGGSVPQSLTVVIEGVTDAPSIEVSLAAGSYVNEMLLHVKSEPSADERVQLRFDNLDPDARIFDADGNDVTDGISNFYASWGYNGDHVFTVVMSDDVMTPVDITVAGYTSEGSFIAESVQSVDLLYDRNESNFDIVFTNLNQSMWGDFDYLGDLFAPDSLADMQDYGIYMDLENLNLQFHEYYPILGNDFMQWDPETGEWEDTGAEYWRSGKFNVVDINFSSTELNTMLADYAMGVIEDAEEVFDATAYVVDWAVQETYDLAVQTLNSAYKTYMEARGVVDSFAQEAWDAAKATYEVASEIYDAASYAFYVVAGGAYSLAYEAWKPFESWSSLQKAFGAAIYYPALGLWEAAKAVYSGAVDVWNDAKHAFHIVAQGAFEAAKIAYDAAAEAADDAAYSIYQVAQESFTVAEQIYNDAKAALETAAQAVFDGISAGVEDMLDLANTVDLSTELTIDADLFARAGLQLDFVLDAGSVDTDVRYNLVSTTEYNQITDMLVITPTLFNVTDDTYTPFSTVSPNASIYAALLYDVGADLDFFLDGSLILTDVPILLDDGTWRLTDTPIFDLSPDSAGISFSPTVSSNGINYQIAYDETTNFWYIEQLDEVVSWEKLLSDLGIDFTLPFDPGELVILDLDSTATEPIALPFLDDLTKGIIEEVTVQIPTVETVGALMSEKELINAITSSYAYQIKNLVGLADDPNEKTFAENIDNYFYDEAIDEAADLFEVVNLEQLTSAFENATISLGDKVMEILGNSMDFLDDGESLSDYLTDTELDKIVLDVATGVAGSLATEFLDLIDGKYETGAIIVVDMTDTSSEALFHANLWDFNTDKLIEGIATGNLDSFSDYNYQDEVVADTGSLGLYVGSGESEPFVSITVDVDAIAAVVISQVLKKVVTAASAGAGVVIEAIPDELLNPFEQKLGLETLLKIAEVPKETVEEITNFINLEYTYTRVDADVIASADFSQYFTLTIDDMTYQLMLEGEETPLSFAASELDQFIIEDASKYDVDGNGIVDYDLKLLPTAMFSNDTELGLNLGLNLEFLAASLEAKFKLPLAELMDIDNPNSLWPTFEIPIDYSFGPMLKIDWEMNGLDIDVYESRFAMDIGTDSIEGNKVDVQLAGVVDPSGFDIDIVA